MMDQQMHKGTGPRGWRKVVIAGGSLAVLVVGGAATANQAFADRGAGSESATPKVMAALPAAAVGTPSPVRVDRAAAKPAPAPKQVSAPKQVAAPKQRPAPKSAKGQQSAAGAGNALARALYEAVTDMVPGQASGFGGQSADESWPAAVGSFDFVPDGGSESVTFTVGIMDESLFGEGAWTCDNRNDDDTCATSELTDGTRLQLVSYPYGKDYMQVVESYVGDIRVTVSTATKRDTAADGRLESVLSIEQLTKIATQPGWSLN